MKTNSKLTTALFGIIIFSTKVCVAQNISILSDIKYQPIPKVSVTPYSSVQDRDQNSQNPKLALGVAISGGGSRAQYFATGVLLGLEEIKDQSNKRNFLNEIDYFSTVSGGCFAAGYYLAVKKNILINTTKSFYDFYFTGTREFNDVIGKSASPLLVLRNNSNERGGKYTMTKELDYEVLQYSEDESENDKFHSQMLMEDFFKKPDQKPILPMFVPNAANFINGERVPFMPHIIAALNLISSLPPNPSKIPLSQSTGTNDGYSLPLTYAITASSAFPGVLPKVKFGVKENDKIICLIDGGAVDNLGYTTLIELLDSDKRVDIHDKKSLIIDCSGEGQIEGFCSSEKIGLLDLLTTTSLYTVQTKYLYHEEAIKNQLCATGIPLNNNIVLGFSTIRNKIQSLINTVTAEERTAYEKLRGELAAAADNNNNWFSFYLDFESEILKKFNKAGDFKVDKSGNKILCSLSSTRFQEFTLAEIFILYEYAAQVETKLKIYNDECDMLVLAGRFAAHLERERLASLLKIKE